MTEEPLIFTSKGNLPEASLEHLTAWHEDENIIVFKETYLLNGEIVKESAHVRVKQGIESSAAQGGFL